MQFKNIEAIMACDPNGTIGRDGKLPWHCPEELEHFSKTTYNHIIIMGYRTFLSLPKSYFEHRIGIVFSRKKHPTEENPNVIFVDSLEAFMALNNFPSEKICYVIGGAQICELFLKENLIKKFTLTIFKKCYEGDVFLPLSLIHGWHCEKIKEHDSFSIYHYFNPL